MGSFEEHIHFNDLFFFFFNSTLKGTVFLHTPLLNLKPLVYFTVDKAQKKPVWKPPV